MDVNISPRDIESIRVESSQIFQAVSIITVPSVVNRALPNLESCHIVRCEGPVS